MVQPMNYNIDVQSPFEAALSGFKIGATVADIQAQRQAQEAQMRAQEAELQRRQMLNSQIASLMQNPNPTARDFANIAMQLPEKEAASMRANWDALSKDKQDNELRFGGQVMSAFGSSQPQIGIQLLRERATAERNSGNEQQAKAYETWAQMAEASPQTAQKTIGIMLAGIPGGDKVIEGTVKVATEERTAQLQPFKVRQETADAIFKEIEARFAPDKFGAELNLTKAQVEQSKAARRASDAAAAKSGAEALRAQAEANQMTAGIIPADKRPEAETKFRKEYSDQTKGYQEVKSAYGRILASEDNAVGDLSLIFGYMKMLDPASVVREGEFATAQNATGVPVQIQNIYNRIISGERLSPSQRSSFKGQAGKLYETAQTQENQVRQGIERIAKGYGLKTENIFYTPTETAPTAPGAPPPAPVSVTAPNGQVLTFPNQQAAEAFKKAAGIR